jgi:hypothetical protein
VRLALWFTVLVGCGRIDFDPGVGPDGGVVLDSTGDAVITGTGVTSLRLTTLEVGASANECLIAGLVLGNQSATDVVLQWNGVAMTPILTNATPGTSGVVFVSRLIAPGAGVQALNASWTGESDAILGAVSFAGADQAECVRASPATTGSSATPSIIIPSAPGHMTLDVAATTSALGTATQTPQWQAATDGAPRLIQQATHGVVAMTDACTLPAPPTAGRHLVFVGAPAGSALQSLAAAGVTWQMVVGSTANSNMEIWYGDVAAGAGTTISYAGTIVSAMQCWVGEFTGLNSAGAVDAITANFGNPGPALPGPLVTTNPHDLLVVGVSNFSQTTWGVPSQGPWTVLGELDQSGRSQIAFTQTVISPGTWNPSIMTTSVDPRWEAVAAAFTIRTTGIHGGLSTAPGAASNTHAWSNGAAAGDWVSIGLDVFP